MEKVLKFINCTHYDFTDPNGKRVSGYSCKCFDPDCKQIIKVKTNKMLDNEFADDIIVNVNFSGKYVTYEVA